MFGNTIYINGKVITVDENNTVAQAVAVKNGKIAAVGTNGEVLKQKSIFTRVVDLHGKTVIPGFVDAHSHFPGSGLRVIMEDLNSPPIGQIKELNDIKSALTNRLKRTSKNKWVLGLGYDDTLIKEKRHPTRKDLDEVSSSRPILIMHISGHISVANSQALAIAGIDKDTKDPEGGVIQRDPETGLPNGVLEENAMMLTQNKMPMPALGGLYSTLKTAVKDYASKGVTTVQSGYLEKSHLLSLSWASRLGIIPLRIMAWPDPDVGRKMTDGTFKPEKHNSRRFKVGAVKLLADGSIQGYTAYLTEPYLIPPTPDNPDYRGYPRIPRKELIKQVDYFHKAGFQIAVHGNGDACIDDILHAFKLAQEACPREDARHIIIHAQMAREDQLDLMKELGVIPSFFVLHTYYWGDRHINIFMGQERAMRISPTKSAIDRNIPFTLHTDTPVVPIDPLLLMWSAVNRISFNGTIMGKEQRITPTQALRAITINSAKQVFMENSIGSIEVGKYADLAILSGNPLNNPDTIKDIIVHETIVGGKSVYRSN